MNGIDASLLIVAWILWHFAGKLMAALVNRESPEYRCTLLQFDDAPVDARDIDRIRKALRSRIGDRKWHLDDLPDRIREECIRRHYRPNASTTTPIARR